MQIFYQTEKILDANVDILITAAIPDRIKSNDVDRIKDKDNCGRFQYPCNN